MRTTLAIDDDVLVQAKALAEQQRRSVGQVLSDLARDALHAKQKHRPAKTRNGLPLLPRPDSSVVMTLEMVNALRDEEP